MKGRLGVALIGGITLLLAMMSLYLGIGSKAIPWNDVWQSFVAYDGTNMNHVIVKTVRFPRLCIALLCGLHFAVAGALMQGITNNPMASPSILGINGGASFGLAVGMILVPTMTITASMGFSFMGATLATVLILWLAKRGQGSKVYLALAGSAITALFMAVTHALVVYFNVAQDLAYWSAGGISGIKMDQVAVLLPWSIIGLSIAVSIAPAVSLLSLGDEVTIGLGGKIMRTRILAGVTVLLLSGSAVAVAGPVGFVGLIVPHTVRYLVGIEYRRVIPCTAIYGAVLVVIADALAKGLHPPFEIPLGAVTALVGVPFFIYLANRNGGGM